MKKSFRGSIDSYSFEGSEKKQSSADEYTEHPRALDLLGFIRYIVSGYLLLNSQEQRKEGALFVNVPDAVSKNMSVLHHPNSMKQNRCRVCKKNTTFGCGICTIQLFAKLDNDAESIFQGVYLATKSILILSGLTFSKITSVIFRKTAWKRYILYQYKVEKHFRTMCAPPKGHRRATKALLLIILGLMAAGSMLGEIFDAGTEFVDALRNTVIAGNCLVMYFVPLIFAENLRWLYRYLEKILEGEY
nr:unnamed protein product [Callosobruchus analis]